MKDREILELKDRMRTLATERDVLNFILQNMDDGVLVTDGRGGVVLMNQACRRLLRVARKGTATPSLDEVVKLPSLKGMIRKAFECPDQVVTSDLALRRRVLHVSCSALPGRAGVLTILHDITERKRTEEELKRHRERLEELVELRTGELRREIRERERVEARIRRLNEELEHRVRERTEQLRKAYEELKRLDEMKDSFLSSVSHELRTPLTSIQSFSEILLQYEQEDPETRREFIEIIHAESERLTRLINDVLDLSKIEAGKMVYNDSLVSMEEIVANVTRAQSQVLRRKSLRLKVEIDEGLPPLYVDQDRIQQVLHNILGNAVKFSHEGGEVGIRVERFTGKRFGDVPEWVKVSVSDQGVGIDEADFQVIFDKFRQVSDDTLKDKPRGTGLGLPISRDIVLHYGGNIWVESRKGEGSTFSFILPVATSAETGAGRGPSRGRDSHTGRGRPDAPSAPASRVATCPDSS